MAANTSDLRNGPYIAGIFHDADAFMGALEDLLAAGFDRASVSVLADHKAVEDHFGRIPDAARLFPLARQSRMRCRRRRSRR